MPRRVRSLVVAGLAGLALAGCSSSGPTQTTDPAGANYSYPPVPSFAPSSAAVVSATSVGPSCNLPDGRDIIVRYRVAGMADSAQELGEADLATCVDTATNIKNTADMQPGSCTWVGWADQNPGYDVNADVAPPLKHVLFAVGPAC